MAKVKIIDTSKIVTAKKRGRGRPRKLRAANQTVTIQLSKELVAEIEQWSEREGIDFRSTAIRHLIEHGLAATSRKPRK
jgi:hypothetical protein